jgi:uncharacterized membrane protein YbaN (DUF454 family)
VQHKKETKAMTRLFKAVALLGIIISISITAMHFSNDVTKAYLIGLYMLILLYIDSPTDWHW